MDVSRFAAFIKEREQVRLNRAKGLPKPWTEDAVLQDYRFCNVRREHDAVTRWITDNWRDPHGPDPDLWFAMVVARLFNNPDFLEEIGYPVPFKPDRIRKAFARRKEQKLKSFNAAYIVSTNGMPGCKVEYLIRFVLGPMWKARAKIRPQPGDTLADFHGRLCEYQGMGSFMAAQVVADVKYTATMGVAADWHTWAASGPGSRRGLNRVMGLPWTAPWGEARWHATLLELRAATLKKLPKHLQDLHAQDIQNCLCEFDKYRRAQVGDGLPKQYYNGRSDD